MPAFVLAVLLCLFHPFFVSVTEIRHNPKTKTVELSVRVFFDDFEKTLSRQSGEKINILKPADRKRVDVLIAGYIQKHLKIKVNGKGLSLRYLGYEIDEDAAWCYFESPVVNNIAVLDVQNDLLFAEHPDQTNMIHAIVNGKRQSTKLDNPEHAAKFSF
jgi:hypothetical protein